MSKIWLRPITPFEPKSYLSEAANNYHRIRWEAHNQKLAELQASKAFPRITTIRGHVAILSKQFANDTVLQEHISTITSQLDIIEKIIRYTKKK